MTTGNQKLTLEAAEASIQFCNSYSRLPAIIDLFRQMEHSDWLRLLGQEWPSCDNVGIYRAKLPRLIANQPDSRKRTVIGPIPEMMTDEELDAYNALPEVVTCYRGSDFLNEAGASWSLDRSIAARFPFLTRYWALYPRLATARVRRDRILAVKLDRNEREIITFSARPTSIERLPAISFAEHSEMGPAWEAWANRMREINLGTVAQPAPSTQPMQATQAVSGPSLSARAISDNQEVDDDVAKINAFLGIA